MGRSDVVTNIPEQSLTTEQRQMLHVLIKRMLMETDPERLTMFAEQIRRITTDHNATEQRPKAA
jgi:hemerythrin superfamily protein